MRKACLFLIVTCCCSTTFAGERSNVKIGDHFLDLEYRAGSGVHRSIVVVDFAATGGGTHAFEYRYDGTRTGHDALLEIADAGDLGYEFSVFDFGNGPQPFVDNFTFGGEQGDGDLFWSYTAGVHDPLTAVVSWSPIGVGAGERILTDGSWDGWYNGFGPAPDYAAIAPAIPTVPLPGDYDDDGIVAQADLDLVLTNWGTHWEASPIATWVNQKPTDDGRIDQNDLDDVLLHWGESLVVGSAAVPEAASATLLCLGMLFWGSVRRSCRASLPV